MSVEPSNEVSTRTPGSARPRSRVIARIRSGLRAAFIENASLKFVAMVLSITIFLLVNSDKDTFVTVDVDLAYTMPGDRMLVSKPVDSIQITVRGSWRRIKRFDERSLGNVRVDLSNMTSGDFVFQKNMLRLPTGIELVSISPRSMRLQFDKRAQKQLLVMVPLLGTPARGFRVRNKVAEPSRVTVEGAASILSRVTEIRTREIDLSGRSESFVTEVPLVLDDEYLRVQADPHVRVRVELFEELVERRVKGIAVSIRAGTGLSGPLKTSFRVKPTTVTVTFRGAADTVAKIDPAKLSAYVQVYADDALARKGRKAMVVVDGIPAGVGTEVEPRELVLTPLETQ